MTNHPNRTVYRYIEESPRGFANEVAYYRVRPDEVAAVEAHYDGWIDRKFDQGQTHANWRWVEPSPRVRNKAIDWADASAIPDWAKDV